MTWKTDVGVSRTPDQLEAKEGDQNVRSGRPGQRGEVWEGMLQKPREDSFLGRSGFPPRGCGGGEVREHSRCFQAQSFDVLAN